MVEVTDRVDSNAVVAAMGQKMLRFGAFTFAYYVVAVIVALFVPNSIVVLHALTAALLLVFTPLWLKALDVWLQGHTTMRRFKWMALGVGLLVFSAAMHLGLMFFMSSWGQLLLLPEVTVFIIVIFVLGLSGD